MATKLNLVPSGAMPVVYINQYDYGIPKTFDIFDGDQAYAIPTGYSVTLRATKPDGYGITTAGSYTVGQNVVSVTIPQQLTAVAGKAICELVFANANNVRVGTINFVLSIEPAALSDNTVISDSDIAYAEEVLDQLQSVQALGNQVAQNTAAISAEASTRAAAVNSLQAADTALSNSQAAETSARQAGDTALSDQIAALQGAVGSPLVAATKSAMTETDRIYVYTGSESEMTSGNWYYYDGSAWVSGGVYNAVAVNTDTTLSVAGMAADAKATGDQVTDLKSALDLSFAFENSEKVSIYRQDSTALTNYGTGAVSAANGRFTADTTHETFIWTPQSDTRLYITRDSANFLRIVEYNKTLSALPSSSANSDYVRGASYEGTSSNLPTANDPWIVPAGHTIAISRANNSSYVTIFTLYCAVDTTLVSLREDVSIPMYRALKNVVFPDACLLWKKTQKTGTKIAITGRNPDNFTYDSSKLLTILRANRFNVATAIIDKSSSASDATLTRTDTGVVIASNDVGSSNRFVYFNYTAEISGRLWVSVDATCTSPKKNDCRMRVLLNGVEQPPECIGEGHLKRYVDVTAGDTVQIRLWYHLYTSTETNTVTYSNIMLCYADAAEYIASAADSKALPILQGDILSFASETSVTYDYTDWGNPCNIVCFGDSITGMFDCGADYCTMMECIMPAICTNVGFSGTTWADHPSTHYVPFSINRLIDSVVAQDFTYQDDHVGSITSDFYAKHLANLKSIDFNTVDVVTFLAGTNDWAFNIPLLSIDDPATENKQRTNVQDAVTYCIRQLLTKYPHLIIIVLSPYWRNREGTEDSNLVPNANGTYLYQFAETIVNSAEAQNVRAINLYKTLGANYITKWYWTIDGTHPTTRTKMAIAQRIKLATDVCGLEI